MKLEYVCILVFLLSLGGILGVYPRIENVQLSQDSLLQTESLPLSKKMRDGEEFSVEFDIKSSFAKYDLNVVPDDCAERISINDFVLDLNQFQGHCDFSKGFNLVDSAIAPYRGDNNTHYKFFLKNNGGLAGLNVFVSQKSSLFFFLNALVCLSMSLFCLLLARRLKMGRLLLWVVFCAVLIRIVFLINVPYMTFSQDVDGHVAYVEYIIDNRSLPKADDCWTCYHPPVYYISAIPFFLIGKCLGFSGTSGLQVFSLMLSVLTLFLGIFFFRKILFGPALNVACILWAFWPVMILVSPRIGNDQMFYMLHLLCMWGGIKYLKNEGGKYLIVAVLAAFLAVWTKMSAVVTLGTVFLIVIIGFVQNNRRLKPSQSELVTCVMFLVLFVSLILRYLIGGVELVGNADGLNGGLKVGNEAFNYLYFDLKSFITHPFTSAWSDGMGREYFWNYVFKTALFGEFDMTQNIVGRNLATLVSCSFLGLVVFALYGFWKSRLWMEDWILLLQGAAFFAALIFLRIRHPYSCSGDFRYILPVVICVAPFVARGVTFEAASIKWRVLGYVFVGTFVLCTMALYLWVV